MAPKSRTDGKGVKGEKLLREAYAVTLRKWRTVRDMNQEELSLKASLPKSVVGSLERMGRPIDLKEIVKLCHALEIDPHRFDDEVHSLNQRAIQRLDASLRADRAREGLDELPSEHEELSKALQVVVDSGKRIVLFLAEEERRSRFRADPEPQQGSGRRGNKPSR